MLPREDVIWAFRYCLGRNPEGDDAISEHQNFPDYRALRDHLMAQPEFVSRVKFNFRDIAPLDPIEEFEKPAIVFIHIQKCAGTTVTHLLEDQFPADRRCPERFNQLYLYSPSELAKFDVYSGHYDLRSMVYIPRKRIFRFCIFREPVARLISYYRFVRAHPKSQSLRADPLFALADELNVEQYFSHQEIRKSRLVNNHYRAVLSGSISPIPSDEATYQGTVDRSIAAIKELDGIGLTEELEASLRVIFSAGGLDVPSHIRSLMTSDDMHYRDPDIEQQPRIELDDVLMEVLSDLVCDDLLIYEAARREFGKRQSDRLAEIRPIVQT